MDGESEREVDEEEVKSSRLHKRRIQLSDSDAESEPGSKSGNKKQGRQIAGSRSSERIKSKKSRIFTLPCRDDTWDETNTNYKQLTPKKLINDFSRINNRYNAEDIDLFEDSSMSDFIDDSNDQSETSTSDSNSKKPHRVKNLLKRKSRTRIIEKFSSSDSDEENTKKDTVKNTQGPTDSNTNSNDHNTTDSASDSDIQATGAIRDAKIRRDSIEDLSSEKLSDDHCAHHKKGYSLSVNKSSDSKSDGSVKSESSSDDDDIRVTRKKQLSTSLLDSDESSSEQKTTTAVHLRQMKTVEKRNLLFKNLKARAKHSKHMIHHD